MRTDIRWVGFPESSQDSPSFQVLHRTDREGHPIHTSPSQRETIWDCHEYCCKIFSNCKLYCWKRNKLQTHASIWWFEQETLTWLTRAFGLVGLFASGLGFLSHLRMVKHPNLTSCQLHLSYGRDCSWGCWSGTSMRLPPTCPRLVREQLTEGQPRAPTCKHY